MNEIKDVINDNETKVLIAVSDTAPSECNTGDLYYNTTDNEIYVATATDTWSSTGTEPTENTIYILFDTKTTYSYDGNSLVSIGGGKAEIAISTTEPTEQQELWINPNKLVKAYGTYISNTHGTSQTIGYSQEYLNGSIGKTIWESSASTMGGTTLSLDLTPYNYIEVIFYTETATTNWKFLKSTGKLKVLASTTLTLGDYIAPNDNSQAPQFFGRNMTINNTKTSIVVGSGFNVSGSTYTTRNSSGVPIEIIGYK
jgi:hypothetical protein